MVCMKCVFIIDFTELFTKVNLNVVVIIGTLHRAFPTIISVLPLLALPRVDVRWLPHPPEL